MEASQLPDVIEYLFRLFKPTLGLHLATFGMSVRAKAFLIYSSDRSPTIPAHPHRGPLDGIKDLRGCSSVRLGRSERRAQDALLRRSLPLLALLVLP